MIGDDDDDGDDDGIRAAGKLFLCPLGRAHCHTAAGGPETRAHTATNPQRRRQWCCLAYGGTGILSIFGERDRAGYVSETVAILSQPPPAMCATRKRK